MRRNQGLYMVIAGLVALSALNLPAPCDTPAKKNQLAGDAGLKEVGNCYPTQYNTQAYSYFDSLKPMVPWKKGMDGNVVGTKLEHDEMRITFMGSEIPQLRRAQAQMSLFVEVGWDDEKNEPLDHFIFDLGAGVTANYQACSVGFARMDKVFVNHLHGDHMTDLVQIYCFGPSGDRKSPLYVWGAGPSGVPNPGNNPILDPSRYLQNTYSETPAFYDDGVTQFCYHLREMCRWHSESQNFQSTGYASYPSPEEVQSLWGLPSLPVPVSDDPPQDAFALIPIELDWTRTGLTEDGRPAGDNIAYNNATSRARVLHYPVIHCRRGSMGYKLEWTPPGATKPLTMVYSSDTRPETNTIKQVINRDKNGEPQGVDILIHEMAPAPEIWAMKQQELDEPGDPNDPFWAATLHASTLVQDSSHTPQGAFGYLLSQMVPRPRLAVVTHFPTADDTVACALKSVTEHCPDITTNGDKIVWSFDLMVLRVFPDRIIQRRAVVNDFSFNPPTSVIHSDLYSPKYHTEDGDWDPWYQLDRTDEILSTESGGYNGQPTYREDGY